MRLNNLALTCFFLLSKMALADSFPGTLAKFPCDLSKLTGGGADPKMRLIADFHPCPQCQSMRSDLEKDSDGNKIVYAEEGTTFGEKHGSHYGYENELAFMLGDFFQVRNAFYGFPKKFISEKDVLTALTGLVARMAYSPQFSNIWSKTKGDHDYKKVAASVNGKKIIDTIDAALLINDKKKRITYLEDNAQSLISFPDTEELMVAMIRGFLIYIQTLDYEKDLFLSGQQLLTIKKYAENYQDPTLGGYYGKPGFYRDFTISWRSIFIANNLVKLFCEKAVGGAVPLSLEATLGFDHAAPVYPRILQMKKNTPNGDKLALVIDPAILAHPFAQAVFAMKHLPNFPLIEASKQVIEEANK
jgi:hypothetical protein